MMDLIDKIIRPDAMVVKSQVALLITAYMHWTLNFGPMFSPDDAPAFPRMCGHPHTLTGPEEDDAPDPPVDTPSAESKSALNILQ